MDFTFFTIGTQKIVVIDAHVYKNLRRFVQIDLFISTFCTRLIPFSKLLQAKRGLPQLLDGASSGLSSSDLFLLGLEHTQCTNTG